MGTLRNQIQEACIKVKLDTNRDINTVLVNRQSFLQLGEDHYIDFYEASLGGEIQLDGRTIRVDPRVGTYKLLLESEGIL